MGVAGPLNFKNMDNVPQLNYHLLDEFVGGWSSKCDELHPCECNLEDSIVEFVMRYVAYTACANVLKNEENRKIKEHNASHENSKIKLVRDNQANTELVSSRLEHVIEDVQLSKLMSKADELSNILEQNNLFVKNAKKLRNILSQHNQKAGFIKILLKVIYNIRCNVFHGEKQYLTVQASVLHLSAQCLNEITPLILDVIRREENATIDEFINGLFATNHEQ